MLAGNGVVWPNSRASWRPHARSQVEGTERIGASFEDQIAGESERRRGAAAGRPCPKASICSPSTGTMLLTRRLDEKMMILLKQGKSFFHIGASGHEAVQIAAAAAMIPGKDWSYPYYRDLAFCPAARDEPRGDPPLASSRKAAGPERAAGARCRRTTATAVCGSSRSRARRGPQYLQAVGCALGAKLEGTDEVVYVSSGEGTTSQGDFHEALNWASREKAPGDLLHPGQQVRDQRAHLAADDEPVYDLCAGYANLRRFTGRRDRLRRLATR